MLHYTTLGTNDLPRARRFYAPVLATLGVVALQDSATETAYGPEGAQDPALYVTQPYDGQPASPGNGSMLAQTATTPQAVEAFHSAALAHGGTDEGAPGLRYSPTFYACYVRDPDGNKLSAVCDRPENIGLPQAATQG
jgi:catechol 2,3-dioxygenase-like lactoylglutathione lyase family enzyme